MGWRDFSKLLRANKMPSARSYDAIIAKIDSMAYSDKQKAVFENFLISVGNDALIENIVAGSKAVLFYKLEPDEHKKLIKHIKENFSKGLNIYGEKLADESFKDVVGFDPSKSTEKLDSIFQDHIYKCQITDKPRTHLVYKTKRVVEFKENIPVDKVNKDLGRSDYNYTEVIGVSRLSMVAFDSITINEDCDYIELRVDFNGGIQHLPKDKVFDDMERHLSALLRKVGIVKKLESVNLFHLVEKTLDDDLTGRVVELHFVTDQGNTKIHKSRKENDGCLYKDKYHNAGKTTVLFDPYRIAKRWKINTRGYESEPELFIPGAYKMLGASNIHRLNYLVILDSMNYDDFTFILNKVYEQL
jgi:hypothetical protein